MNKKTILIEKKHDVRSERNLDKERINNRNPQNWATSSIFYRGDRWYIHSEKKFRRFRASQGKRCRTITKAKWLVERHYDNWHNFVTDVPTALYCRKYNICNSSDFYFYW